MNDDKETQVKEIEIIKKEDGEIIFKIDGEENKFEYEYFDKLIELDFNLII